MSESKSIKFPAHLECPLGFTLPEEMTTVRQVEQFEVDAERLQQMTSVDRWRRMKVDGPGDEMLVGKQFDAVLWNIWFTDS